MKKIDKLLVTSFVPPFIMTFIIAIFVLIMQFLWTYIDEIIGKGVSVVVIVELLFYQAMALVPLALPIATLISSVMVMGGLGERYELASMKSAGISLTRIMAPLMVLASGIAVFSFICANWLIPIANLQFKSRLYDIRKQKPTLSIVEGTFTNDITGFVMRVGKKEKDDKTLHDVMIYDHTANRTNDKLVRAKDGEMGYSKNKQFLIMNLKNGQSFEDVQGRGQRSANAFPFLRTKFETFNIVFDLEQFQFKETDRDAFRNHQSMMTLTQLFAGVDSINKAKVRRTQLCKDYISPYFYYKNNINTGENNANKRRAFAMLSDAQTQNLPTQFLNTLADKNTKVAAAQNAQNLAKNVTDYFKTTKEDLALMDVSLRDFWIEIHVKFSLAYACLMFLFIGAPMGAIIRKGGFGWPILVSILFFVTYMVLFIIGKKLGKDGAVSPFLACWFPNFLLSPMGIFITYQALRDSALMNLDAYTAFFQRLWEKYVVKAG
jgi:lipopolysaccharide export system permease protein